MTWNNTVWLSHITVFIISTEAVINKLIWCSWARTSMHPQVSFFSPSQRTITYWLVRSVYAHTHFPHVPLSCHISPGYLSISTLPFTFLIRPLPHAQKQVSALRKCDEAGSGPPILLPFHGGDEIFKRHSCLHLIACQHVHQLICAGWSGSGPSATKHCVIKTQRWLWRGNVKNGFSSRKNIISNSYLVFLPDGRKVALQMPFCLRNPSFCLRNPSFFIVT